MQNTDGMTLNLTRTACKVAARKGLTPEQIQAVFDRPKGVYASETREGQYRIVADDICIVGVPREDGTFLGITFTNV